MQPKSPSTIEQIKAHADLLAFARDTLGIDLKKQGREWVGLCPVHSERTPSFFINPAKQMFICRGCGVGGDIINLTEQTQGLPTGDAVRWLARHYGIELPQADQRDRRNRGSNNQSRTDNTLKDKEQARAVLQAVADYYHAQLTQAAHAQEYLASRGIPADQQVCYLLGYAPADADLVTGARSYLGDTLLTDRQLAAILTELGLRRHDGTNFFQDRLMFPVADSTASICGFAGRRLNDQSDAPKYVNSPDSPLFQKKRFLYGLSPLRRDNEMQRQHWQTLHRQSDVTVVEGYTDVLAMARAGRYGVATMGTAMTDEQLALLQRRGFERIVFCFDGDRAGQQAAVRVTEKVFDRLRDGDYWGIKLLPNDGGDVDDYLHTHGAGAFDQLPVISCSQYWLSHTLQPIQQDDTLEQRVRVWRAFAQWRSQVQDNAPVMASLMEGELQRRLGPTPLPVATGKPRPGAWPAWHGRAIHPAIADMLRLICAKPTIAQALPQPEDPAWVERRLVEGDEPAFAGLKLVFALQRLLNGDSPEAGWALFAELGAQGMPADWLRALAQVAPPGGVPPISEEREAELVSQWPALVALAGSQHRLYPVWALTRPS